MTASQNEELAVKIIEYLQKNELFYDTSLYLNNKKYHSDKYSTNALGYDKVEKTQYGAYYVTNDIDVTQIVKYCNPDTITMIFEGPLYDAINYGNGQVEEDLNNIAAEYDLYLERGFAWSLAFYNN